MLPASTKNVVEQTILRIGEEYRRTKGLILTEADLKCLIYSRLRGYFNSAFSRRSLFDEHAGGSTASFRSPFYERRGAYEGASGFRIDGPVIPWRIESRDQGVYASPVHAELAWYDESGRLAIKPDITILDPRNLSILRGFDTPRLPSKQYAFEGEAILLELKFIRNRTGINTRTVRSCIMNDFRKIEGLHHKLSANGENHSIFCYFIIFNKTSLRCDEFVDFMREHAEGSWYKTIYASGGVCF